MTWEPVTWGPVTWGREPGPPGLPACSAGYTQPLPSSSLPGSQLAPVKTGRMLVRVPAPHGCLVHWRAGWALCPLPVPVPGRGPAPCPHQLQTLPTRPCRLGRPWGHVQLCLRWGCPAGRGEALPPLLHPRSNSGTLRGPPEPPEPGSQPTPGRHPAVTPATLQQPDCLGVPGWEWGRRRGPHEVTSPHGVLGALRPPLSKWPTLAYPRTQFQSADAAPGLDRTRGPGLTGYSGRIPSNDTPWPRRRSLHTIDFLQSFV